MESQELKKLLEELIAEEKKQNTLLEKQTALLEEIAKMQKGIYLGLGNLANITKKASEKELNELKFLNHVVFAAGEGVIDAVIQNSAAPFGRVDLARDSFICRLQEVENIYARRDKEIEKQ